MSELIPQPNKFENIIGKHIYVTKWRNDPDGSQIEQRILLRARVYAAKGENIEVIYEGNENLYYDGTKESVIEDDCIRRPITGIGDELAILAEEDNNIVDKKVLGQWHDVEFM